MCARPYGVYLVISDEIPPFEFILGSHTVTVYNDGLRIADKSRDPFLYRRLHYKQFFKVDGVRAAIPVHNENALLFLMERYHGPWEEQIRGIASCIYSGTPYGSDDPNPDIGGGERVPVPTPPPTRPSPAAKASPLAEFVFGR